MKFAVIKPGSHEIFESSNVFSAVQRVRNNHCIQDDGRKNIVTLLSVSQVMKVTIDEVTVEEKKDSAAKLKKKLEKIQKDLEAAWALNADILGVVEEFSGQNPVERAGPCGNVGLVAKNLLCEAVRLKAEKLNRKS